jgi:uncharacterized membrane protein
MTEDAVPLSERTDPRIRVAVAKSSRLVNINVGLVLGVLAAIGGAYGFLRSEAKAQASAGVEAAKEMGNRLEQHKRDSDAIHQQLLSAIQDAQQASREAQAESREGRRDTKAVYDLLLSNRRQARMEQTLPPIAGTP